MCTNEKNNDTGLVDPELRLQRQRDTLGVAGVSLSGFGVKKVILLRGVGTVKLACGLVNCSQTTFCRIIWLGFLSAISVSLIFSSFHWMALSCVAYWGGAERRDVSIRGLVLGFYVSLFVFPI
jgi:hypothetical protein